MAILEKFAMRKFITLLAAIYCQALLATDIDDVQSQVFDGSCALSGCHNGSVFPNLSSGSARSGRVRSGRARLVPEFDG
jgi:hypothetical protein